MIQSAFCVDKKKGFVVLRLTKEEYDYMTTL